MKFLATLLMVVLPGVALAQQVPTVPAPPLPTLPGPPPTQAHPFEPTVYCLYNGIPYSRGSRLYQGGFAMSCDSVPAATNSLVWQLVR
jgi:hypothetical protein